MAIIQTLLEIKATDSDINLTAIENELQQDASTFRADTTYPAVPMQGSNQQITSYIIRGGVDETQLVSLKQAPTVIEVFSDTPLAPFAQMG